VVLVLPHVEIGVNLTNDGNNSHHMPDVSCAFNYYYLCVMITESLARKSATISLLITSRSPIKSPSSLLNDCQEYLRVVWRKASGCVRGMGIRSYAIEFDQQLWTHERRDPFSTAANPFLLNLRCTLYHAFTDDAQSRNEV
jgi:hypothetical protein